MGIFTMECSTWLVTLLKTGIPIASLLVVISVLLIEQNKNPNNSVFSDFVGTFFGYFSLFFSGQYVNSSGQKWRYLFIVSLFFLIALIVIMKTAKLSKCL